MIKEDNTICNLPPSKDYPIWSERLLRQRIAEDKKILDYLVFDEEYCVSASTIALYQFQNQPLWGKFKSAIFDSKCGIVLSGRSTKSHLTSFAQKCLFAGLEFQREFARQIGLAGHNVIATGRLAYFSTRSYNTSNLDWVALHQMADYQPLQNHTFVFETVSISDNKYLFAYRNCSRHLTEKICNSLFFNHALYVLNSNHLEQNLGWRVRKFHGKSLIDQSANFHPHQSLANLSLKSIMTEVLDKKHLRYGNCLADFYELPQMTEAHKKAYYSSKRPDSLY